jgi:hypothetical protein
LRLAIVKRKFLRQFDLHRQDVIENLKLLTQGSLGRRKRKTLALAVEQELLHMEKIAGRELLIEDGTDDMSAVIRALHTPLARLAPQKRAMYEHLFELVYECSTNRTAAKAGYCSRSPEHTPIAWR